MVPCEIINGINSGRTFIRGSEVGRGDYGIVYKVTEKDKQLAMKLPRFDNDADSPDVLLREATTQQRFRHPFLMPVEEMDMTLDAGVHEPMPMLVTPLAESDLESFLNNHQLSGADAMTFAEQTASGLTAIHSKGLVYVDIKAKNVLLRRVRGRLQAQLGDFGAIAQPNTVEPSHSSPVYPPEYFENGTYDEKSDQYVWATQVAYPLATGYTYEQNLVGVSSKKRRTPFRVLVPRRMNEHLEALDEVVGRAMQESPEKRYASMESLYQDLVLKNFTVSSSEKRNSKQI